jgi:transcription-repair coupling factor (superfamily II helicase)
MKTKLLRITKYLNVTINSASKRLFEKNRIHFKKTTLSVGDYVTHIDTRNWTRLEGCKNSSRRQNTRSQSLFMPIMILYVSIHSHKISKYNGKDGTPPKIYKLGSNWKILKQNQGARQTYYSTWFSCMLKEDSKDSSLRQIVICKTNGSFIYEDTQTKPSLRQR